MPPRQPIELAIIICTFKRPALLAAALRSIATQDVPDETAVRVIVVDNSDDGSAIPIVAEMSAHSPIPMRLVQAHPPNISVARNAGVAASTEPYIAFIDDDETCEPGWLAAVVLGLRTQPHDVLFGRVESNFETPERASAAVLRLFSRQLDVETGYDLFAFGARKSGAIALATNNSIFRRATTLTEAEPFDAAFGQGGGEDYDLFCRLQRAGCRFGWLPDAIVSEFVPASRCEERYLRRRFFAGGQAFAAAVARGGGRHAAASRWWLRVRACAQAVLLLAHLPLVMTKDRKTRADYGYQWAGVLGKMSFGAIYPLYRETAK